MGQRDASDHAARLGPLVQRLGRGVSDPLRPDGPGMCRDATASLSRDLPRFIQSINHE